MTTTYEAWVIEQAPIFSRLPEVYRDNPVTQYLITFWDELLAATKDNIDDLPRQLNPLTCDENWLDFLAPLCSFTGIYWDKEWNPLYKRRLLANSYKYIWSNKGSKDTLSRILTYFNIKHLIVPAGSFIFGESTVGSPLGLGAWEYTIYLPTAYQNRPQFKLTEKLNRLFGPLWCESHIILDDKYFPGGLPGEEDYTMLREDFTALVREDGSDILREDSSLN